MEPQMNTDEHGWKKQWELLSFFLSVFICVHLWFLLFLPDRTPSSMGKGLPVGVTGSPKN
jgi:hypothetical protein